jgi:tetratricopeptide (TPR) repeat protein
MSDLPRPAESFFQSLHAPYYIYSPPFTQKSAGPRVLHYLCHILNELGYEAYVTYEAHVTERKTSPWLRTPELTPAIMEKHRATERIPIAVYPEITWGNPLRAPVVARWLLNKPGHLIGPSEFSPDELLFFWSPTYLESTLSGGEKNAHQLVFPIVDRRIFNDAGTSPEAREGFCYYAHKYLLYGGKIARKIAENGTSLCQDVPLSAEEIAAILRKSKVLYSYEPSAIRSEAYACGCPVVMVETDYLRRFCPDPEVTIPEAEIIPGVVSETIKAYVPPLFAEMEKNARPSVDRFIDITQAAARAQAERAREPDYRLKAAIAAFASKDYDQAAALLTGLLDEQPENPTPYAYLSFISATRGLTRKAGDFIGKALALAPQCAASFKTALGEAFLEGGNPGMATKHLEEAITIQPDLFPAYPLLARGLYLTQRSETALVLLQSIASIPMPEQGEIRAALLDILAAQGDVAGFTEHCLRFSRGLDDDLRAVRGLACLEDGGGRLVETLGRVQTRLAEECLAAEAVAPPLPRAADTPLVLAFLVGDFAREARLERLAPLLLHLPTERFVTVLIVNDAHPVGDYAQTCLLAADYRLSIASLNDDTALVKIDALTPDVLIDLDAYGPEERLSIFLRVKAGKKLQWSEVPLPAITPASLPIIGARLAPCFPLPASTLPQLGEYHDLPELPIATAAPVGRATVFGCLTPAAQVGPEGWSLFAQVLHACPGSRLVINLDDLEHAAQSFVGARFAAANIAAERLEFVHARSAAELCALWQRLDLGLAPPAGSGDLALITCLWMGRPYVALAPTLPWSARPSALLAAVGANAWVVETPGAYVARAAAAPGEASPAFRDALRATGLTDPVAFAEGFAAVLGEACR